MEPSLQTLSPAALVESDRVHRDVYLSDAVFALEQERLFGRAWLYVGHLSQIPRPGDYMTADLAGQPVILVRATDDSFRVFFNRCAHKGSMIVSERTGHTGRAFRCPYHSWTYRLDGSLLAVPAPGGYDGTQMRACETGSGLTEVASAHYRGFVFARLAASGPSFEEHCSAMFHAIDALVDRSPAGEVEVAGLPLRNVIACNWKVYLENINDAMHANVTHESASMAAERVWSQSPPGAKRPMGIEILMPFGSDNEFLAKMGGQVFANGHSIFGSNLSIHSAYSSLPDYEAAMEKAYGAERARKILSWVPQNSIVYPSIAFKSAPQTIRVIRPLAADRTLIEVWAFRPKNAPDAFLERTLLYNRIVFSPMSIVAHDDIHVFETIQKGLRTSGNPWVSLHREHVAGEADSPAMTTSGTNEILMRNQFRAWRQYMAADSETGVQR
jgi:phenylpropionate dioxygenase-like ring-hydroxylating dioxygenase large terminal subunit